jgi:hypothetical protein
MKYTSYASVFAVCLIVSMMFAPAVISLPPEHWEEGDEVAITGHSFDEEYWTADISNTTDDGAEITMTMSYVNNMDAQAFLLAFKTYEKDGNISTLPYQLFGMHFTGLGGHDVFIGAVLAFLMVFNDTYDGTGPGENGMPDPAHEDVYYVIPFGVGGTLTNGSYVPTVTAIEAESLPGNRYRFGMKYENLYAKIIDANNPLALILSAAFPLYIARFSELTIVYDITFNEDNTITTETFYTLGQVTQLWLLGQEVDPMEIPDNWGVAAVHYVARFGSTYKVTGDTTNHIIDTGIQGKLTEGLDLSVGEPERRVFNLGLRGTFDLINESTQQVVAEDEPAYNMIVKARLWDLVLVAWQGGFSLGVMATMAYALSPDLQALYAGPLDLFINGKNSFITSTLWYAVSFPRWNSFRVEHDPVYTAYLEPVADGECGEDECVGGLDLAGIFLLLIIIIIVVVLVAVAVSRSRGSI